jgi:predicted Zn-dependent peptidase
MKWIAHQFSVFAEQGALHGDSAALFPKCSFEERTKDDDYLVICNEKDEGQLRIGFPGFSHTDERSAALLVLANMIGGSNCSLLSQRLQQQLGIAYWISSYTDTYRDCGLFVIHVQMAHDKIYEAFMEIMKLFRSFEAVFTDEDFAIAKQITLSNLYLLMDEDSTQITKLFGRNALYGVELPMEDLIGAITMVEKKDVCALAREIFSRQPAIAVMGPFELIKIRKRLRALYKKAMGGST